MSLSEQIEDFLTINHVDDSAGDSLRQADPEIQRVVLAGGDIPRVGDPSAYLIRRIGTAKRLAGDDGPSGQKREGMATQLKEEIEDFIEENEVDDHAGENLRQADPDVQRSVLEEGSLNKARNPSACLMKRIKTAKDNMANGAADRRNSRDVPKGPVSTNSYRESKTKAEKSFMGDPLREEVEDFIEEHDFDDKAGDALRVASAEVQRLVLDEGSMASARNPSSMLMKRIQTMKAKAGRQSTRDSANPEVEDFIRQNNIDKRAGDELRQAEPEVQRMVLEEGSVDNARNPSACLAKRIRNAKAMAPDRQSAGDRAETTQLRDEVEDFIEDNDLDERASDDLRQADAEVQRQVLEEGNVGNARNPSSCVQKRIRTAKATFDRRSTKQSFSHKAEVRVSNKAVRGKVEQSFEAAPLREEIEDFIVENRLDERAGDDLLQADPEVQRLVIEEGSLENARNPSACLIKRIKTAKASLGPRIASGSREVHDNANGSFIATELREEVEDFIEQNDIDSHAGEELRQADPEVQQLVLEEGSLENARNPSACLVRRILTAKTNVGQRSSKNRGEVRVHSGGKRKRMSAELEDEIADFIEESGVDDDAADALWDADPEIQRFVLEEGSIMNARNPSALLKRRIRAAEANLTQPSSRDDNRDKASSWGSGGVRGSARPPPPRPPLPPRKVARLREEVEDFLEQNQIDKNVADDLRQVDAEVQRLVLEEGDIKNARNPSACLVSRINSAQNKVGRRSSRDSEVQSSTKADWSERRMTASSGQKRKSMTTELEEEIEDFLEENEIDENVANDLRQLDPQVAELVLEEGNIKNARNPSGVLVSRIKSAKAKVGTRGSRDSDVHNSTSADWSARRMSASSGRKRKTELEEEIEDFLEENEIDETVANDLRQLDPEVAELVLEEGNIKNARNPSGVLVSRIKSAKAKVGTRGSRDSDVRNSTTADWSARRTTASSGRKRKTELEEEIEDFIEENEIDENVANDLRQVDPEVQRLVLEEGNIKNARNPSACLVSRINSAKAKVGTRGSRDGEVRDGDRKRKNVTSALKEEIEDFLEENDIDDHAARELWDADPEVQSLILEEGNIKSARNPSALLMRRIRVVAADHAQSRVRDSQTKPDNVDSWERGGDQGSTRRFREEVEDFIDQNDIDRGAGDKLLLEDPEVQRLVLEAGKIGNARNPSGVLMRRIQTAKVDLARTNLKDRAGVDSISRNNVEKFLNNNDIDDNARNVLLDADPEVQLQVVMRGDFVECRNPSSALMSRIKQVGALLYRRKEQGDRNDKWEEQGREKSKPYQSARDSNRPAKKRRQDDGPSGRRPLLRDLSAPEDDEEAEHGNAGSLIETFLK